MHNNLIGNGHYIASLYLYKIESKNFPVQLTLGLWVATLSLRENPTLNGPLHRIIVIEPVCSSLSAVAFVLSFLIDHVLCHFFVACWRDEWSYSTCSLFKQKEKRCNTCLHYKASFSPCWTWSSCQSTWYCQPCTTPYLTLAAPGWEICENGENPSPMPSERRTRMISRAFSVRSSWSAIRLSHFDKQFWIIVDFSSLLMSGNSQFFASFQSLVAYWSTISPDCWAAMRN